MDWAREIEMSHTNGQSIYPDGRHPMVVNRMEQYVSNLTSIRRLLERTSDPRRDIDAECGFPKDGDLTANYFRGKYDRDAIANRVVQLLPKETWQVQPRIYESEDAETATPFEEAWDALARNLRGRSWYKDEAGSPVWEILKRADILSGIGHYGIILIGIDDGKQLHEPVDGVQVDSYADQVNYPRGTDAQYTTPFGGKVEYPDSKLADSDPKVGAKGKTIKVEDQYGDKPKITKPGKGLTGNAFGKPRDENVEEGDGKAPPFGKKESGLPDRGKEGLDNSEEAKDRFGLSPEAGGRGEQFEELDRTGDPEFPDEEVKPFKPKHRLTFLRAYDETLAQITQWDSDPSSPRFGHPLMYNVQLFDPRNQQTGVGLTMQTQQVHWTRVIHLADNLDCSDTFGVPRLKAVLNNILGLQKVYGGDPEAFWKNMMMRLFLETHPQLGPDVDIDLNAIKDVMENMENGLQRWATLTGMAAKTVAPSVVDPTSHINAQIEAICILLGCPVRIFKGSERGELASSQDDSAWNDRLRERQLNYLSPRVIIPFVDRLIQMGVLPEPSKEDVEEKAKRMAEELPKDEEGLGGFVAEDPTTNCYLVFNADKEVEAIVPKGGYSIEWPDLDSLGRQAKAQIAQTRVAAMSQYQSGQVSALMAPMDFLTRELGYEEEEADSILQNATEHQDEMAQQGMVPGAVGGFPGQGPPPPFGEGGEEGLPPGEDPNDPFGGAGGQFDPNAGGDGDFSDEELDRILNNVGRGWPREEPRWVPITNKRKLLPAPKDTGVLRPSIQMRGIDRRLDRVSNAGTEAMTSDRVVENSNPEGYNQYKHRGIIEGDPFVDPEGMFGHRVEYPRIPAKDRRELEREAQMPRPGRTLVDISDLVPTQDMTGVDKASSIAREYDDKKAAVTVYGKDGKNYIYDGHHTAVAAILTGRKQMKVNYIAASTPRKRKPPTSNRWTPVRNEDGEGNCGTGSGGFKKGNTCAGGGSKHRDPSNPRVVLGDVPVPHGDYVKFLGRTGAKEWRASPRPDDVDRGTPKECFKNASLLMLRRDDLDYCEGVAYIPQLPGVGFLHAWCVDRDGNVVDNTWDHPEDCTYYGVKYDRERYLKHIFKTKMYGVFGGDDKVARKVLKKGGL